MPRFLVIATILVLTVIPTRADGLGPCSPKRSSPYIEAEACGNTIARASWKTKTMIAQNRPNLFDLSPAFERAMARYDEAIRLNPDDVFAYYDRAMIYHKFGDIDRAIADYSQVIRLTPNDADAYFDRGNAYFEIEEFDRAIADYDQVIRLEPDNAGALFSRANAYYDDEKFDRAIADYGEAIRLQPDAALAYMNRGNAYHGSGKDQTGRRIRLFQSRHCLLRSGQLRSRHCRL